MQGRRLPLNQIGFFRFWIRFRAALRLLAVLRRRGPGRSSGIKLAAAGGANPAGGQDSCARAADRVTWGAARRGRCSTSHGYEYMDTLPASDTDRKCGIVCWLSNAPEVGPCSSGAVLRSGALKPKDSGFETHHPWGRWIWLGHRWWGGFAPPFRTSARRSAGLERACAATSGSGAVTHVRAHSN